MAPHAAQPPHSLIEMVSDVLHGIPVPDPYRWLEDQHSPRTRAWIAEQTRYTRHYLEAIPGRARIRERIREYLTAGTYDSIQKAGTRYFFRRRFAEQEQPCICVREEADSNDQVLIDPAERGTGNYTAVKPLHVSPDGRLLLYEVKEGGERTSTYELLDIKTRKRLPDILPRGYLRGFAFAPDSRSFFYVHEPWNGRNGLCCAAFEHRLGSDFSHDREIFSAGQDPNTRLYLVSDKTRLGFLVNRYAEATYRDFYVLPMGKESPPSRIIRNATCSFGPLLVSGRVLAMTDRDAPNLRIVELRDHPDAEVEWVEIIPEEPFRIHQWVVVQDSIFVSYFRAGAFQISVFDMSGRKTGEVPIRTDESIQLAIGKPDADELLFETESFTKPLGSFRFSAESKVSALFTRSNAPIDSEQYSYERTFYTARDGIQVPVSLLGRREVFAGGVHPAIMTSYGGFGAPMSLRFSVFVTYMLERGCLFVLPGIRGGSEFGSTWHRAAMRTNRQTAYNDFIDAAEWLTSTGRTVPQRLAIFGGSNSGLLVGASLTQRPDLFRAVICMVPMLDMLRYHLFDSAYVWKDEFGTADDPTDFAALLQYSPYHRIRDGTAYPATLIVSGDSDRNCNPLHARKMVARLQAANVSGGPVLLDYSEMRGHSPVLPLSVRVEALTDRMAFLCDQLQLSD